MLLCSTAWFCLLIGILVPALEPAASPPVSQMFLTAVCFGATVMYLTFSVALFQTGALTATLSLAAIGGVIAAVVHGIHFFHMYCEKQSGVWYAVY